VHGDDDFELRRADLADAPLRDAFLLREVDAFLLRR